MKKGPLLPSTISNQTNCLGSEMTEVERYVVCTACDFKFEVCDLPMNASQRNGLVHIDTEF